MNINTGHIVFTDSLRLFLAQSKAHGMKSSLLFKLFGMITIHMNCRFDETLTPDWLAEQNIARANRNIGDIFSVFDFVMNNKIQIHTDLNGDSTVTRVGFDGEFTIV